MRQIYPGVFILDTVQTPQYRQSKAGKYIDIYTNQRYENWQTSLKLAELEYKKEFDVYTARQKALDSVTGEIDKDIEAQRREAVALEKELRGMALSQDKDVAAKKTAADKYTVNQKVISARAAARDAAIRNSDTYIPATLDKTSVDATVGSASQAFGKTSDWGNALAVIDNTQATKSGVAESDNERNYKTNKWVKQEAAARGMSPDAFIATAPDDVQDRLYASFTATAPDTTSGGSKGVPASGPVAAGAYSPTFYGIDPEALNILRNIEDRKGTAYARTVAKEVMGKDYKPGVKAGDDGFKAGSVSEVEASRPTTTLRAPSNSILDRARDIYGSQFESLPNYERKQEIDNAQAYLNTFVQWKLSKLPDTATSADINAARAEGIAAAVYYANHGKLPPAPGKASKASKSAPSAPAVDSKKAVYAGILGTDGNYQINYNAEEDGNPATYTVVKGDKPAVVYAEGTDEFKLLEDRDKTLKESAESIQDADYTWKKNTEGGYKTRSKWVSNGLISEYGPNTSAGMIVKEKEAALPKPLMMPEEAIPGEIDLGRGRKIRDPNAGVPKQEDLPKEKEFFTTPEERQRKIRIDLFKRMELPELGAALESLPSTKDVPLTDKQLEIKPAAKPSLKNVDTAAAAREMLAGNEMLAKPKKAERLLSTTPVGLFVNDLWDSNERLDTPKDWISLREQVIRTYGNETEKRDRALQLLAYRKLASGREGKVTEE